MEETKHTYTTAALIALFVIAGYQQYQIQSLRPVVSDQGAVALVAPPDAGIDYLEPYEQTSFQGTVTSVGRSSFVLEAEIFDLAEFDRTKPFGTKEPLRKKKSITVRVTSNTVFPKDGFSKLAPGSLVDVIATEPANYSNTVTAAEVSFLTPAPAPKLPTLQ